MHNKDETQCMIPTNECKIQSTCENNQVRLKIL